MLKIVDWFKLPTKIRKEIEATTLVLDCLDTPAINKAVNRVYWYNLPTTMRTLATEINKVVTTEYTGLERAIWYRLDEEVNTFLQTLKENNCL